MNISKQAYIDTDGWVLLPTIVIIKDVRYYSLELIFLCFNISITFYKKSIEEK